MRKSLALFLVGLVLTSSMLMAEEEDKYTQVAVEYLRKHSTPAAEAKWQKKWDSQLEDALSTSPALNENSYLDSVVLGFLAGKKLETLTEGNKVQVCRYYLLYKTRDLAFPGYVRDALTGSNLDKVLAFEMQGTAIQTTAQTVVK